MPLSGKSKVDQESSEQRILKSHTRPFPTILFISLSFMGFFLNCQKQSKEDLTPLVLSLLAIQQEESLYPCPGTWNFPRMLGSGVGTVCTQCHNEELRVNQFVVTDYQMVLDRVVPRRPRESLVFQKVTEGSMRFYANEEIRQGIYCWIRQGARR